MIDVSGKDVTVRIAKASGEIQLSREAFDALRQGACPKGDVLTTARIAAIQAVKSTPTIIPMCHPIAVESIDVTFDLDENVPCVVTTVMVRSYGKTGVEMEALCGVAAACLTIYDMLKYKGQDMTIEKIRLVEKSGGRSGHYKRSD
jgi:cyclic pyranopterin phosphate synthase